MTRVPNNYQQGYTGTMQEVQIPSSCGTLQGTLFHADSDAMQQPAALLIHGWTSAQNRMYETAEMLSKRATITCLTVDLRGHGRTGGDLDALSRKDFLNDAIAAYDFLALQEGIDKNRMGVLGSSFGSYLAALLTAQRKVAWVVLRVPADYPDEGFEEPQSKQTDDGMWREQPRSWDATATLRAVHNFHGKVLIVESENDELVPRQTLQNYKKAVRDEKDVQYVVMKSAPHSLTKHPELKKKFNEIVFEWEKNK